MQFDRGYVISYFVTEPVVKTGRPLVVIAEDVNLDMLGSARRVRIERENTKEEIQVRIQQLRQQIAGTTSDYDREKLEERVAKLAGSVALNPRRRRNRSRGEGTERPRRRRPSRGHRRQRGNGWQGPRERSLFPRCQATEWTVAAQCDPYRRQTRIGFEPGSRLLDNERMVSGYPSLGDQ